MPLRIAFIGAGAVNFGGGEGPWDHASRLELIDGLEVVGVADPDTARARAVLEARAHPMFRGTRVFPDFRSLLDQASPDAVWIGVPPSAHGTCHPRHAIECACVERGVHMFIEKPLSAARPELVRPVADAVAGSNILVSVGYMFRYSRAVETMRALLREHNAAPRAFIGRYNCAYSRIAKRAWWDVRQSGGPVVEQLTHFADLARFLCGDVIESTIAAHCIPAHSPAAALSDMPVDETGAPLEESIPVEFRVPRATLATWRFRSGGLGSLAHGVLLHQEKYFAEVELWCDGLFLQLRNPYGDPVVRLRRPGCEEYEDISFAGDDPYRSEDRAFIEALRTGDASTIRCNYGDALSSFELTWAISDRADDAYAKD